MVMYKIDRYYNQSDIQAFVSETEFDRGVSQIERGPKDTKTAVFPKTIREISADVFRYTSIQSAVLSEGLERLERCVND